MKKLLVILLIIAFEFIQGASLDSYLKKELSGYKSFTYKVLSLPTNIKSISDKRLKIDSERRFRMNKGFAYIPVKVQLENRETFNAFVSVKLKLFADVYEAKKNIKKGEKISTNDFRIVRKEISGLNNNIVINGENFSNCRAKHTIIKGRLLDRSMIGKIPIVYRGDNLQAYSVFGSVVVNFLVTTREDGNKGDIIRVVRSDNKLFKAKVIDNKKVKIVE